jgi:hypothetical protein
MADNFSEEVVRIADEQATITPQNTNIQNILNEFYHEICTQHKAYHQQAETKVGGNEHTLDHSSDSVNTSLLHEADNFKPELLTHLQSIADALTPIDASDITSTEDCFAPLGYTGSRFGESLVSSIVMAVQFFDTRGYTNLFFLIPSVISAGLSFKLGKHVTATIQPTPKITTDIENLQGAMAALQTQLTTINGLNSQPLMAKLTAKLTSPLTPTDKLMRANALFARTLTVLATLIGLYPESRTPQQIFFFALSIIGGLEEYLSIVPRALKQQHLANIQNNRQIEPEPPLIIFDHIAFSSPMLLLLEKLGKWFWIGMYCSSAGQLLKVSNTAFHIPQNNILDLVVYTTAIMGALIKFHRYYNVIAHIPAEMRANKGWQIRGINLTISTNRAEYHAKKHCLDNCMEWFISAHPGVLNTQDSYGDDRQATNCIASPSLAILYTLPALLYLGYSIATMIDNSLPFQEMPLWITGPVALLSCKSLSLIFAKLPCPSEERMFMAGTAIFYLAGLLTALCYCVAFEKSTRGNKPLETLDDEQLATILNTSDTYITVLKYILIAPLAALAMKVSISVDWQIVKGEEDALIAPPLNQRPTDQATAAQGINNGVNSDINRPVVPARGFEPPTY